MAIMRILAVVLVAQLLLHADGQMSNSTCRGISRGKEFVVAFTANFISLEGESHISVVAFSDEPTIVTISSRYKINGSNYQVTFGIPPKGYRRITIPFEFRLSSSSIRSTKVLAVEASSEVTVYGTNLRAHSTDAFLSLPNNQLGTHYVVVSVMSDDQRALLAVIGVVDGTNVYITLTAATFFEGQVYEAGDIISLIIGKHEVVQIMSNLGTDISGTIIKSDHAIAAFGGHACASTPSSSCDVLIEQLIPVSSWGTSHIFTGTSLQNDTSIYKIAAFFANTVVIVPGLGNRTLEPGGIWEVSLSGSGVIHSTRPASVTQILLIIDGGTVDPSIIQVPSEEQFAFKFGFATPPKSAGDDSGFFNYANLVVKSDECVTVSLNGHLVECNGSSSPIPGTNYVVLRLTLPKGDGVYFIEQSNLDSDSPMSIIVFGFESAESFGYAAGLSLPNEGRLLSVQPFIVGDNGGDVISATLPCLKKGTSRADDVICRYRHGTSVRALAGVLDDFYQVICPTYIFSHVGFIAVDVSVDGAETFPYTDMIYVASQFDLPPRVTIGNLTPEFPFLDLRARDSNAMIIWDPMDFANTTNVDIAVFAEDSREIENGGFDEILLESSVPNNGRYDLKSTILQHSDRIFGSKKQSIVGNIFVVAPSQEERLRGGIWGLVFRSSVSAFYEIFNILYIEDCQDWHGVLKEGTKRLDGIPPCPPDDVSAQVDNNYRIESKMSIKFFHPGATACFRRNSENSGSGTQCCYGDDGSLMLGPPGGGTADTYNPKGIGGIKDHFRFDVRPWVACCHVSNKPQDCQTYYKYRPSMDSEGYEPPAPAIGTGDPHMITLDQFEYTFNAAGEFFLLLSELHNVNFQGRMEEIPGADASVFTAFALRAGSSPILQIQRSYHNRALVLLDGRELQLEHQGITLLNFLLGDGADSVELEISSDQTRIVVRLTFGLMVTFDVFSDMMSYTVNMDKRFRGHTQGLLGNFNGDPNDDLTLPNGDVISPNSSLWEIHYNFGLGWMVNKSDSIFTYIQSENYESFSRPEFEPNLELPNLNEVDQEVVDLCGTNTECLFDAVSTGSLSFANDTLFNIGEYRETREVLQRIVHCNFPRDLNNSRMENIVYYVNSSYTFQCEEGFTLVGEAFGLCGEDGEWSWANGVPSCLESKTCTIPADFETGEASNETYFAGNSYEFSCSRWFFVSVGETLECNEVGNWNADFPSCVSVGVNVLVIVVLLILVLIAGVVCVVRVCTRNKSII